MQARVDLRQFEDDLRGVAVFEGDHRQVDRGRRLGDLFDRGDQFLDRFDFILVLAADDHDAEFGQRDDLHIRTGREERHAQRRPHRGDRLSRLGLLSRTARQGL